MNTRGSLLVIALLLCSSLFLIGCVSHGWREMDCPFDVPAGIDIQCGYLPVPENRSRQDGPVIRLQVAIVKPLGPHSAPDPVVVLNEGPGSHTLAGLDYWLYVFNGVLQDRTLILYDPRGVGYSQPALDCPEVENEWRQDWAHNLSLEVSDQNHARALRACHDRLASEGVDLSAYTTAANAADLIDLRLALGYRKWNLYGGDYGSRLALEVMRQDPGGVRSVILDSTDPPQVSFYKSRSEQLEQSLNLLFERCAADTACNQAYPNLRDKFRDLADGLDSQPGVYRIYDPLTSQFHDLYMNGDRWVWAVSQMFYGTRLASTLPKRISTVKGDMTFSFGHDLNALVSRTGLSEGVYYSIQCVEELSPLSSASAGITGMHLSPRLPGVLDVTRMVQDCASWEGNQPSSSSNWAVTSSIPALILAGELDPITPPAWGRLAAQTLSHSQYLEFPGFGHGILGGGPDGGRCTIRIVRDFFDHPEEKLDTGCIQALDMGFLSP
jgi:pimeloyl-ACP methyl ester carboxylesterase